MSCLIVFLVNSPIAKRNSSFKPGDSCLNQLLSIIHEIYKNIENGLEVRGVVLDASKTFDRVQQQRVNFQTK